MQFGQNQQKMSILSSAMPFGGTKKGGENGS